MPEGMLDILRILEKGGMIAIAYRDLVTSDCYSAGDSFQ